MIVELFHIPFPLVFRDIFVIRDALDGVILRWVGKIVSGEINYAPSTTSDDLLKE